MGFPIPHHPILDALAGQVAHGEVPGWNRPHAIRPTKPEGSVKSREEIRQRGPLKRALHTLKQRASNPRGLAIPILKAGCARCGFTRLNLSYDESWLSA
jgi:hypothetical protein